MQEIKQNNNQISNSTWSQMQENGSIYIHNLDSYGLKYNSLALNFVDSIPYGEFTSFSETDKILHLFNYIKDLLIKLSDEQSGGVSFTNFDNEFAEVLSKINVKYSKNNLKIIGDSIKKLITWCNSDSTPDTCVINFNIGLAENTFARKIAEMILDEFDNLNSPMNKVSVVFKVCKGINLNKKDSNYNLYFKALRITIKKPIITYILCDSETNSKYDPKKLAIVGESKILNDVYGNIGATGRGCLGKVSINLPRIALEIDKSNKTLSDDEKIDLFYERLDDTLVAAKDILIDHYNKLCKLTKENFKVNLNTQLWCESFDTDNLENVFKHGTLTINFVGISEVIELLTGGNCYSKFDNYIRTLGIVKHMRDYCDFLKKTYKLNFTLSCKADEFISHSFIEADKKLYANDIKILTKDSYTNSFYIDINSKFPWYRIVALEGLLHKLCNGGCITYIELDKAPIDNVEGLDEFIKVGIKVSINYLGFSYKKTIKEQKK